MKKIKITLLVLLGLFVVGVAGSYYALSRLDLNQYKDKIREIVFAQTGRTLDIKGDIKLNIGRNFGFSVNDVSFSNAPWASYEDMVSVGEIRFSLDLLPLLTGKISIEEIAVLAPEIRLETSKKGAVNYDFSKEKPAETKEVKEAVETADTEKTAEPEKTASSEISIPNIHLESVLIEDAHLVIKNQQAGTTQNIVLNRLSIADSSFGTEIETIADIDGQKISLAINMGKILDIGKKKMPLEINGDVIGVKLKAAGNIGENILKGKDFDISFDAMIEKKILPIPDSKISFKVYEKDGIYYIASEGSNIGSGELVFAGELNNLGAKPYIKLDTSLSNFDIAEFDEASGYYQRAHLKGGADNDAEAPKTKSKSTRVIPDSEVDLSFLKGFDADISVKLDRAGNKEARIAKDFIAKIKIANGELNLNDTSVILGGAKVAFDAAYNANSTQASFSLKGDGLKFSDFVENSTKIAIQNEQNNLVDINIKTSGKNVRTLAKNLSGSSIIVNDGMMLESGYVGLLSGNIIDNFKALFDGTTGFKTEKLNVKCAVVRTDFAGGKVLINKSIALDSDKAALFLDGDINLDNEKINIMFSPYTKDALQSGVTNILSSIVAVKGTLAEPSVGVNDKEIGKTAVSVGAAIATAGLSIVGERMVGQKYTYTPDVCFDALKNSKYSTHFKAAPKPADNAVDKAFGKENVEQGKKAIDDLKKDLFKAFGK